jgi:mycofactocin glycosyltransferase
MRDAGWQALYVPSGFVMHKHRNTLGKMLRRRADYGTSEAILCKLHPLKRKTLQWRFLATAAFLGLCFAIAFLTLFPIVVTGGSVVVETAAKALRLHRKRIRISFVKVGFSVLRMYMSYFYMMSFHLARYYLVLLLLLGFAFHSLWGLGFSFLIFAAFVDYSAKRPRLAFPAFFFYYILDHLYYQHGVLAGCFRARSFRACLVKFIR